MAASFFTPGTTLSVRARRALFESGNASINLNRRFIPQRDSLNSGEDRPRSPCTVRKPLSFVSPNNVKNNATDGLNKENSMECKKQSSRSWSGKTVTKKERITNLKMDISELQKQVQHLDEEKSQNRLVNAEKECEGEEKDKTLMKLNKKLTEIQKGLIEIEDERECLLSKMKQLEREKQAIQLELDQREKEINTLTRRCSMQADQTKNSTQLLSLNKKLSHRIVDLENELQRRETNNPNTDDLKKQLLESISMRDELRNRLSDISKDHEAMSEKLRVCLETCEKLTEEKREQEKEHRRVVEKASLELEKQRLKHEALVLKFEADLYSKNKKIDELDNRLIEKVTEIQKLREELSLLEENQEKTMKNVADEYQRQIANVSSANLLQLEEIRAEFEDQLKQLESKIEEKDKTIAALRHEIAAHMEDLMSASSALNKQKEDSKLLESLTEDVEMLEHDRCILKEELHEKDTNIAELSAEILKLEIEKELLEQDSRKLHAAKIKLAAALAEKEAMRVNFEVELQKARNKGLDLEKRIDELNERNINFIRSAHIEHDEVLARMRAEIHDVTTKLQQQQLTHEETMLRKEGIISNLERQLQNSDFEKKTFRKTLAEELHEVRSSSQRFEEEIQRLTKNNTILINRMNSDHEELLKSLRSKVHELEAENDQQKRSFKSEISVKDNTINSLRVQLLKISDDVVKRTEVHQSERLNLERDLQKAKTTIAIKDDEIRDLRMIELQDRDDTITSLRSDIVRLKDDLEAKEKQSAAKIADLESCIWHLDIKYSSLECQKEEALVKHAIACEQLQKTICDLKRDLEFSRISEMDLQRKFDDYQRTAEKLKDRNVQLEHELERLRFDKEAIHTEREKLLCKLEGDSDVAALKQKYDIMKTELEKAEEKLVSQQAEMARLEESLSRHSETLSSVIDINKQSEAKLEASERRYNVLEEKASTLQVELMDSESRLSLLRSEFWKKENEYLDQLHEEQNRRQMAEANVMAVESRLETFNQDKKELTALRKENEDLRDKVHRQDAFMQRKLNAEKVRRDHGAIAIPRNHTPARRDNTPVRKDNHAVQQSKLQRPCSRGQSRIPKSIQSSQVTCSTVDESESLEVELESLLAD